MLGTRGRDGRRRAEAAGLVGVVVEERPVDVGVTEPEQLVELPLRPGPVRQPGSTASAPAGPADIAVHAADAIRPIMRPYRPTVVFLAAATPA